MSVIGRKVDNDCVRLGRFHPRLFGTLPLGLNARVRYQEAQDNGLHPANKRTSWIHESTLCNDMCYAQPYPSGSQISEPPG
jgi:hypothetical protein